jgi:hypothetical protein
MRLMAGPTALNCLDRESMSKKFGAQATGAFKKMSVHPNRAGGSYILGGIIDEQAIGCGEAISIE